jgi:hypothetical protein
MNLGAMAFVALCVFVGSSLFTSNYERKYHHADKPAPIEQVQPVSGDTVSDGDTATVNK